ncbi:MAG: hypothetical protein N0C81_12645 [Candidatus Thiodiazotropha lotti]|uniref:Uncharacterized protein n=1 Tax=Candidatus Thiodiazotropha lotti TaxID=2792787 RepID=A0A9E4K6J0_9GAMM|nr:hypothetical protein [Candidatus Thiodiazotropha lotti]ODC00335.1 hypothetical protein A3197_08235 [Candidatus Thiodiazotropha endoloripes]MCG7922551.1 hypothetical protein [Candidatus Thiodiazotropha lotti]MCG7939359.1 hypothetical protein [Candidatus Thiodiazotropha lotti]MCG7984303.1 hypothetical protein [Candidatus Thiodiazotropha lotti]
MPTRITNDQSLRDAIGQLSAAQQRALAGKFVASVEHLSADPRISRAVQAASNPDLHPQEIEAAYKDVKSFATQTYTACGRDADWAAQAEHFVAAAAAASLAPDEPDESKGAWRAAMQARMAKNCEMILNNEGGLANESEKQYELAEAFIP